MADNIVNVEEVGNITVIVGEELNVTGENVNVAGVGVYKQKDGTVLQFKGIASTAADLVVTDDAVNNQINLSLDHSKIQHNNLGGYVANDHIDHSTVSIVAGYGLSGGGDLTQSRTIEIDNSPVTTGTYGDAYNVASFTVDQKGRIVDVNEIPISFTAPSWGSIVGTLADQTDLQMVLSGKSDTTHNHDGDYAPLTHNHDLTYAPVVHNHDGDYAPLTHNHDLTYAPVVHNHDGDYAPLTHNHDLTYAAIVHNHDGSYYTENEVDALLTGKSDTTHNHDGDYAAIGHNHDLTYAAIVHNHDGDYAAIGHNHDLTYAAIVHNHDGSYYTENEVDTLLLGKSDTTHNHDLAYAPIVHNHDSDYAALTHNHDTDYAPLTHSHTISSSLTDVVISTPTTGQVLTYDGTYWINDDPSGGGVDMAEVNAANPIVFTDGLHQTLEVWNSNQYFDVSSIGLAAGDVMYLRVVNKHNMVTTYNWGSVVWEGGTTPAFSSISNTSDIVRLYFDGAYILASMVFSYTGNTPVEKDALYSTIDMSLGEYQYYNCNNSNQAFGANVSGVSAGRVVYLRLINQHGGTPNYTWSSVVWSGGVVPNKSFSTSYTASDIIRLYYDGTYVYASLVFTNDLPDGSFVGAAELPISGSVYCGIDYPQNITPCTLTIPQEYKVYLFKFFIPFKFASASGSGPATLLAQVSGSFYRMSPVSIQLAAVDSAVVNFTNLCQLDSSTTNTFTFSDPVPTDVNMVLIMEGMVECYSPNDTIYPVLTFGGTGYSNGIIDNSCYAQLTETNTFSY